jgi:MFS family permease
VFRLYVGSRFLSAVAIQMVNVAVGWQVYELTGDPLALGMVGLAQFLPAFLLTLPGGQVADRFDRRRILQLSLAVLVAAALVLLGMAVAGRPAVGAIYGVLAVIGVVRAFLAPASQSLVPLLVGPELFPRAVALNSSAWQVAVIAGPAAGGLLYALGAEVVYGVAATLFAVSTLAVSRLEMTLTVRSERPKGLTGVLDGVKFVLGRKDILGAISLDLFAVLLGGAVALLPVYARDILDVGPWGLGLLRAAPGVGAVAMALYLARYGIKDHAGRILFVFVALFGFFTMVFGLSTSVPLSIGALVLMGACDMVSVYIRETLLQLWTPDEVRGRVNAVNRVFIGASNELGEFRAGTVARLIGAVAAVALGGAGTMGVAFFWSRWFPELRTARRLDGRG